MEDLKKKINFDPALLYFSNTNENKDDQSLIVNMETYNRKHVCTTCGKRFFTNNSLIVHMEHHSPDDPVNSDKEKDDSNSDWKNRFVLNKGISCNKAECNFIALDSVDYNKHLLTCEGIQMSKNNNAAFCESCNCYFSCENYFNAHCILQHLENSADISLQEQDAKNTKISDPVCLYLQGNKPQNSNRSKSCATHSMYPDSFVSKKKLKETDLEVSPSNPYEEGSSKILKGNDSSDINYANSCSESNQIFNEVEDENVQQKIDSKSEVNNSNEKVSISENASVENNENVNNDVQWKDNPDNLNNVGINQNEISQNPSTSCPEESVDRLSVENSSIMAQNLTHENLYDKLNSVILSNENNAKVERYELDETDKFTKNSDEDVKSEIKNDSVASLTTDNVENKDKSNNFCEDLNKVYVSNINSNSENVEKKDGHEDNNSFLNSNKIRNEINFSSSVTLNHENVAEKEVCRKDETELADSSSMISVPENVKENDCLLNKINNSVIKSNEIAEFRTSDFSSDNLSEKNREKDISHLEENKTSNSPSVISITDAVQAKNDCIMNEFNNGVKKSDEIMQTQAAESLSEISNNEKMAEIQNYNKDGVSNCSTNSNEDATDPSATSNNETEVNITRKNSNEIKTNEIFKRSDVETNEDSEKYSTVQNNNCNAKIDNSEVNKAPSDTEKNSKENSNASENENETVKNKSASVITEDKYLGMEKMMHKLFKEHGESSQKETEEGDIQQPILTEHDSEETKSKNQNQSTNDEIEHMLTTENLQNINSESSTSITSDNPVKPEKEYHFIKKKYLNTYIAMKKKEEKLELNRKNYNSEKSVEKMISASGTTEIPSINSVKKRNRYKTIPEDHMIKQRSIRQRKKLILPDYEYGFDHKNEFGESGLKSDFSETSGASSILMEENEFDKKRGRPRKQIFNRLHSKPFNSKTSRISRFETDKHVKSSMDYQEEEFSLNTSTSDAEISGSFNESSRIDDENLNNNEHQEIIQLEEEEDQHPFSWLKKVDFREHSTYDSWSDEPRKKKLGRPRKNKLARSQDLPRKISNLMDNSISSEIFKKRSKPKQNRADVRKHMLDDTSECIETEISMIDDELDNEPLFNRKYTKKYIENQIGSSNISNSSSDNVSPKKRGRPCKVKPTDATFDTASNRTSTCIVGTSKLKTLHKNKTYNIQSKSHAEFLNQKKKGRPRKIKQDLNDADQGNNLKSNVKVGDLGCNTFKDHIRRKNSPYIKESASANNTISPKKYLKSFKEPVELQHQTKLLKKENVKKGRPTKYESLIKKKKHLQLMKIKKRKREFHDLELLNAKKDLLGNDLQDHCDRSNNIEPVISSAETIEEKVTNVKNKKEDLNLSKVIKQEPRDTDEKDEVTQIEPMENVSVKSAKKTRKILEQVPKSKEEDSLPPDQTKEIDEALFLADTRARNRYSKVFKKPQISPQKKEFFSDWLVTCGRCHKKMTLRHYTRNHQISHYYLCWLEGEQEINLNDDSEVIRILQSAINPEALRKKAIRLSCESCDKTMKSVIGYVSHVRFCTKRRLVTDETELFEKCILCGKALKPSSIRHHYVKFHGVSKFVVTNDGKISPDLTDTTKIRRNAMISPLPPKKNYLLGFERVAIEKSDILNDQQFWTSLKTSYDLYMCMGLSCRHMTLSKDDLKTHILNCGANFCEFSCSSCSYKTKYESEIIYHSKKNCKETSDIEDTIEEKAAVVPDRRVSTRVKKRKYIFDFDDEDDRKKSKTKIAKHFDDDADFEKKSESSSEYEEDSEPAEKKSRFNKKKFDTSSNKISEESGLRQAFIQQCSLKTSDPLTWTVDVRLKTFSTCPVHMNLKVDINEWETFPITDLPDYSPMQQNSMKVSFDSESFTEYRLFQSDVIKGVPLCFTGGPVWSMAWAPLPAHVTEQYLAVAGLSHMDHLVEINKQVEFPSLIQIWKFSSLDNISNDIHKPTLAWAIAHKFGAVWSMEWCPSGGLDNTSTPYRLGILALATSSGCAVVYSVPRLDCGGETRSIVANPEPDLILKIRCENVQCTRIVWQRNYLHSVIYGGFSNGTVALWNISTVSTILKKGNVIYPHRTFEAYNTAITVLDVHWLDNSRFLLTGSLDRILKFWDLEDLSGPLYEMEKSNLALSAVWMHHWIVTANCNDFFSAFDQCASLVHPRDLTERKKSLSSLRDSFWSVGYSDWNDMVALSTNGGSVSVFAAKHLSALTFKLPDFEKIVTETKLLPLSDVQKNDSVNAQKSTSSTENKNALDCSSLIDNYGLQFCDRVKARSNTDVLNFSVEKNNAKSINKVCWNQNYNSFNWLAVGYECGFVRVIRVERFDKHHLTKFYKMNENSSITLV